MSPGTRSPIKKRTIGSKKNLSPHDPNFPKQLEEDTHRNQAYKFLKGDISNYFKKSTVDLAQDWGLAGPEADLKRGNLEIEYKRIGFVLPNGHVVYVDEKIGGEMKAMGLKTVNEVRNQTIETVKQNLSKSKSGQKDKVSLQILAA
jgi:hypothetical protein